MALAVITPVALVAHRELDLLGLDDDTPRSTSAFHAAVIPRHASSDIVHDR